MSYSKEEYLFMEKIPGSWTIEKFGDLFSEPLSNGVYKSEEYHGSGIKIINMGELFNFEFISNQDMKRLELTDKEEEKYCVEDEDLLFARRSLVLEGSGKCSIVVNPREKITFESSIIRVRLDKSKANALFYYYLFRSPLGKGLLLSIATQTAVSGIRGSDLTKLKVPYPPISEQNKFVEILYRYDKLIMNNKRKIKHLMRFGDLLFKEWFINNSPSIDRFKNQNKFRLITKNIAKYEGTKEYFATANVSDIDIIKSNLYYAYEEKPSRAQKQPVMNSVWFARMKASKKVLCFNEINKYFVDNSILSSGFLGLKTEKSNLSYLFFLVNSEFFNLMKDAYCTGATQESLNNDNMKRMKIIIPDKDLVKIFDLIAKHILNSVLLLQQINEILFEFENNLISLLFSDKNDVHILDKVAQEVEV